MKKLLLLWLLSLTASAFAINDISHPENSHIYCEKHGGKIIKMEAKFSTYSGEVTGITKEFCRIDDNGSLAYIGLETLSKAPTIAATYVKSLKLDSTKMLPTTPYGNPSLNVCQELYGSEMIYAALPGTTGFSDEYGASDICMFGDGSSIAAWSLIYAAEGKGNKIKNMIRSEPMNIKIPTITYQE